MHREVLLAAFAVAVAACSVETKYVPRTPHRLALGMVRGEPGVYLDGVFMKVSDAPFVLAGCSATAAADAERAATEYGSAKTWSSISGVAWSLGWLVPPLFGLGAYLSARTDRKAQQSYASTIDAINRFNDDPGCAR